MISSVIETATNVQNIFYLVQFFSDQCRFLDISMEKKFISSLWPSPIGSAFQLHKAFIKNLVGQVNEI
jgi:hypothetical protein